jgi:hypothetical protein
MRRANTDRRTNQKYDLMSKCETVECETVEEYQSRIKREGAELMAKIDAMRREVNHNLNFIDVKLSEKSSPGAEDVDGIIGHGMELAAVVGLCAKTLADAKRLLNMSELRYMNENRDLWNKATILRKLMDGTLAEENSLVTWADRLMSACTHKMDFYRTVVSKYKEELRLNNQFNTQ